MYEDDQINAFKGGIAIGVGIGLLSGIASTLLINQYKKKLSADDILKRIKKAFLKEGPIEGSWINFEKQPVRKFAIQTEGYNGGITRLEDNHLVTYEFWADAKTGSVLDIQRIDNESRNSTSL
ncbi:PepSY domain-containing protein [Tetragenococcus muriaticus]|uniref:PepSY domain-containing protein n=2 Tax=Tetragenococcus muriaticus TaxID=64642 RepID=A0A091CED9_9ENTE|nr:PepSY domain-containing protein [Tetragenococcus muriaticus]KFN92913.1 hypothetical protein TMU3MR103_0241 [Tetragenococcus muriaticus 3MR10-3]KFN93503.1 hypothetical protein TMUPMC115_0313 [Tetragenococcus muriaticus PMC-11-5]